MKNSFYTEIELMAMGFASIGSNVLISKKTSFYGVENISIGNDVRIDDYCTLSGKITIGNHVHIAVMTCIFAGEREVNIGDYTAISSRVAIYSKTSDFSGDYFAVPMLPEAYLNDVQKEVSVGKYVIIGTGCTILPGVSILDGCAIGAMSLVNKDTLEWGIYFGIPAERKKERSKNCLRLLKSME